MQPNIVVIHHVKRDRIGLVFALFRERIGEPRDAPVVHPHREVLPLDKRRADMLFAGPAFDRRLDSAGAGGGAVTALGALSPVAIEFDQRGVIDIRPEDRPCGLRSLAGRDWQDALPNPQ